MDPNKYEPNVGQASRQPSSAIFIRAYSWLLLWLLPTGATSSPTSTNTSLPVLTTAQQVLDLGLEAARHAPHPVRVQGWVTYAEPDAGLIYVQDVSAGLRVLYAQSDGLPAPGQLVMVEGRAAAGIFAPFIDKANVSIIDPSVIPDPCEASAERMAAGELFGQWVQMEGVIRDVAKEPHRALMFVSSGGLRFHAVIHPYPGLTVPVDWLDARVVLRGVCRTEVDAENKPSGFTLYVPGTNYLFFLRSGMKDPFQQPAVPVSLWSELRRPSDARIRVTGTVVFHSLSGHLYLQEEGAAVHARLLAPLARGNPEAHYVERPSVVPLRPGERVEVIGAPTATTYAPLLQDSEFRRMGSGTTPTPAVVSSGEIFSGQWDGHLIALKGRLLAEERRQVGPIKHQVLALQSGGSIFEAIWEFTGTNRLPALSKNSYLQAAGICAVQLGEVNQVRSFRLLLREPSDLRVLGHPPWWEPLPLGKILAVTTGLVLAALVWIGLLRRQVAQRTAELRAEAAERQQAQTELRHALAAERELSELRSRFVTMVSHEFRTPLGVILSAAENLQNYAERLKTEQRQSQLQHIVQATRHMAKLMEEVLLLGRAEAGKLDFNPAPLNLAEFCERVAHQVETATAKRCPIHFRPGILTSARGDERLLRHTFTNLLTNAVKYSSEGSAVEFTVEQESGDAVFRVIDRGMGIALADHKQLFTAFHRGQNASHLPGSGLGLVIVKRCVELHGGQIVCESQEGKGTTFIVRLPLFVGARSP